MKRTTLLLTVLLMLVLSIGGCEKAPIIYGKNYLIIFIFKVLYLLNVMNSDIFDSDTPASGTDTVTQL